MIRVSSVLAAAAVAIGSAVVPAASTARAASTCEAGWTAVGTSLCQLIVTASGTVTLPAGVATFDVLVAGGGGGGGGAQRSTTEWLTGATVYQYAGGGGGAGAVTLCKGVSLSGAVAVVIGDGGTGGSGAVAPASSSDGSDGTGSSIGTCAAAGGTGGQADNDSGVGGGAGGASGSGFDGGTSGGQAGFAGGGGGATQQGGYGDGSYGGNGGRGYSPVTSCFAGSNIELGVGGGGGANYAAHGGLSWSWDPATGTVISPGFDLKMSWSVGSQTWLPNNASPRVGGVGASGELFNVFEKFRAGDAGPNSGGGGGGGIGWQPWRYTDGNLYPSGGYPGGAGGSGVVILRYSIAGAPEISSVLTFADDATGGVAVRVFLSSISCDVSSVEVGDTICENITTEPSGAGATLDCVLPAGNYEGKQLSLTDGGGVATYTMPGSGGGTLPETGADIDVALPALCILVTGFGLFAVSRRCRTATRRW